MSVVGLIPAAGFATRLGLSSGSKEVQPVRGRPMMLYLVERMRAAGADPIRVVTRPEKQDVIELAEAHGVEVLPGSPATASESLRLATEGLAEDDIVLFGFPDTIWTPVEGFLLLRELVERGEPVALGVFESPHADRCDAVTLDGRGRVTRIDVKPERVESPLVWACGAARCRTLREATRGPEPGREFGRWAEDTPLAAARLGRLIDVGTPAALKEAENDPMFTGMGLHLRPPSEERRGT